jgi:hypothetical protein
MVPKTVSSKARIEFLQVIEFKRTALPKKTAIASGFCPESVVTPLDDDKTCQALRTYFVIFRRNFCS